MQRVFMTGFLVVAISGLSCTGQGQSDDGVALAEYEAQAQQLTIGSTGEITVYKLWENVDTSGFIPLDPGALGGEVLEGDVQISFLPQYFEPTTGTNAIAAGLFRVTQGTALVTFPFTEHATLIRGWIRLTAANGETALMHPGDSYLIRTGTQVTWKNITADSVKSFFNYGPPL